MHIIKPDHYRRMLASLGEPAAPSRRGFLQGIAAVGGALVIGLNL